MFYPSLLIATDQRGFANEHLSMFVTMSTGSGVGEQFALLKLYVQIDDIHDPLSASSRHNDSERAAEVLARNKKNLKSWQTTWPCNPSNLTVRAERQWGRNGWLEVQGILANIAKTIELSYSEESCYFRVAGAQTNPGSRSESELSALGLKTNKTSTEATPLRSLTLAAKIDLAYDLVQCGFYPVGTPWLASLSSKHLRGFGTKDRRVCVLGIETMPLEYIWFDNPDGLRESSQLFQIGVILIEIALDSAEVSDLAKEGNPRLFVSETLALVYKALEPIITGLVLSMSKIAVHLRSTDNIISTSILSRQVWKCV